MNNLKELKEQYSKTQEELIKLGETIEKLEKEKNKRHRVNLGDVYFFIDDAGYINSIYEDGGNIDDYRYNSGNYYLTKEDCEKAINVKNTEAELRNLAEELNDGEEIDWENDEQRKYQLYYYYYKKEISTNMSSYSKIQGTIYCLDKNFKDKAIERIGEDKLKEMLTYEQI